MVYFYPERGGHVSAGVCQIHMRSDHVRLVFVHGTFLPDPLGLLEGERKYMRYVRIDSYAQAPWEALEQLIQAACRFDPYTHSFRDELT